MVDSGWNRGASPFHEGELAIQERLGVRDRIDRQGRRMIRDYLIPQHRQFFAQLPYVVMGGLDELGHLWTSMLTGPPGFLSTPDEKTLCVKSPCVESSLLFDAPLSWVIRDGSDVGFLGIDLSTRRRNRINGVVSRLVEDGFEVSVRQSFGNCPQYIQAREIQAASLQQDDLTLRSASLKHDSSAMEFETLSAEDVALILKSDTFFISTAYQSDKAGLASGVDVSHRGGKPGFVRIDESHVLTVPDFSGNNHFNTFGNLVMNPQAGLLFVGFEQGDLLHLSGQAEVIWEGPDVEAYEGAERLFRFYLKRGYRNSGCLKLQWSSPEFSPYLEKTGIWSASV